MEGALLEYVIHQIFQEEPAENSGPAVAFQVICPE